jgi:hypothetical protein
MDGEGYRWKDSEFDSYPGGYMAFDGNPVWAVDNFNDMMFRVFGEVDNDVGVEDLIAPLHQELYREIEINALIKNFGANNQGSFGVECVIWDPFGSVVLNDVKTITSLDSGEATNLIWNFIPMLEGIYYIDVITQLPGDEYPVNDLGWVDINVQAAAVLKLHDDIKVGGGTDDWLGTPPTLFDSGHSNRREYIWKDAVGDDTGDGDYTYPTDPRFEPGCLDLRQFRVSVDGDSMNFLLRFGSIDDGSGDGTDGPLGFSEQIIEILIDMDRDGTGRDDTIRNARLRLDDDLRWELALWVDGWGNGYLMDEFGDV